MSTIVATLKLASIAFTRLFLIRHEVVTSRLSRRPSTVFVRTRSTVYTSAKAYPTFPFSRTSF